MNANVYELKVCTKQINNLNTIILCDFDTNTFVLIKRK